MTDTYIPSKSQITKKWFIIDATDQNLGRLSTRISKILTGKEKATYSPFLDLGDNIIVITKTDKATIFFAVLYFETQHNPCENIPTHSLSYYRIVVNNFYKTFMAHLELSLYVYFYS